MGRILSYMFPVLIVGIIGFIFYRNKRKTFQNRYADWEHAYGKDFMKW